MKENIKPATGRLGVLVVGVGGAVATTMITGTLAARKGLAKAIGSITQMAAMRMQDGKEKLIKDIVPLADLNDIVFGGWDIFPDNVCRGFERERLEFGKRRTASHQADACCIRPQFRKTFERYAY